MYCTISAGLASSGLTQDAIRSHARLRTMARELGSQSDSSRRLAEHVTSAYLAALTAADSRAWAAFVAAAAALARHSAAFDGIVAPDRRPSEALRFFEAIVRENDDLLAEALPAFAAVLP
jgi:hypothetical protein